MPFCVLNVIKQFPALRTGEINRPLQRRNLSFRLLCILLLKCPHIVTFAQKIIETIISNIISERKHFMHCGQMHTGLLIEQSKMKFLVTSSFNWIFLSSRPVSIRPWTRSLYHVGMYRLHQKARQGSSVDLEAKLNPPYVCSALSQKVQLSLERRHVDAALTEACRTAQKAGNQSVRAGVLQWIKPF